jgi:predicted PurR-regulated permease PerM
MLSKDEVSVRISVSSILWAIGLGLLLYFLYRVQAIVITVFFSVIVMAALRPSVKWMERRLKFPKILAMLVLYALFISVISLAVGLILPPLLRELPNFIHALSLPPSLARIYDVTAGTWGSLNLSLTDLSQLVPQIGVSFGAIYSIISSTFSGVLTFVTVLVMSSYMMMDRENLHMKIIWFTRDKRHIEMAKQLVDDIEVQLGGWVRGQVSLMLIIGIITYIGLTLLSIPYALPLAIAAGALEVLPNLGPTIAAVPAVVVAYLTLGPAMAAFVVLFYILVQQFENNLIVPKVMKDNADVNPLTTIILILVGIELGGVIGALLAVPVYIVIRTIYAMWYREKYHLPNRVSA